VVRGGSETWWLALSPKSRKSIDDLSAEKSGPRVSLLVLKTPDPSLIIEEASLIRYCWYFVLYLALKAEIIDELSTPTPKWRFHSE
jgi:hypothetical protein